MDIMPPAPVRLFGLPLEGFNLVTLLNSWLIMAVLLLVAWLAVRRMSMVPGHLQAGFEMITEFFESICNASLGGDLGRRYMPFIATLFLFVFACNVIGIIPNLLAWAGWPGFVAPTQDLNTPLGLAILVLLMVHISAIRIRGFREWLWGFYEPSFPSDYTATKVVGAVFAVGGVLLIYVFGRAYVTALAQMATPEKVLYGALVAGFALNCVLVTVWSLQMGKVPNAVMMPLNVVGEVGKAISHPFRLFGNIFGGFVIIVVISHLILYIGLPPFLRAFFGIFIGLVQAFVFAMLALAYTAVQVRD